VLVTETRDWGSQLEAGGTYVKLGRNTWLRVGNEVLGCRNGCRGVETGAGTSKRLLGCRNGCRGVETGPGTSKRVLGCRKRVLATGKGDWWAETRPGTSKRVLVCQKRVLVGVEGRKRGAGGQKWVLVARHAWLMAGNAYLGVGMGCWWVLIGGNGWWWLETRGWGSKMGLGGSRRVPGGQNGVLGV